MKNIEKPLGKKVGQLSDNEKKILIERLESSIKSYKIGMIFAVLSIALFIGIFIAPSLYYLILKFKKRIHQLQTEEIDIYEVSGALSLIRIGRGRGIGYVCKIAGRLIPGEYIQDNSHSNIRGFSGQNISFQYLPQISKNRQFYNTDGQGYNFITDTILTHG